MANPPQLESRPGVLEGGKAVRLSSEHPSERRGTHEVWRSTVAMSKNAPMPPYTISSAAIERKNLEIRARF